MRRESLEGKNGRGTVGGGDKWGKLGMNERGGMSLKLLIRNESLNINDVI